MVRSASVPLCPEFRPDCDACAVAAESVAARGGVVECVCGSVHGAPTPPPAAPPRRVATGTQRARDGRVWRAADDAPAAPAAPLARQGAAATALHVDDPELVRVRSLLAALRPDCPNPWEPPPRHDLVEAIPAGAMPRDSSEDWGGIPRGLFSEGAEEAAAVEASRRCVAEVLAELRALPPDAAAVLRWLREHATLGAGLRGLYADVGLAFADEAQAAAWGDLGARREGAPAWGRKLVLRAADAWGR